MIPWLIGMFKASIALVYVHRAWRLVRLVYLPNPGNGTYSSPKYFRPISQSSFLLKPLQRLVDRDIKDGTLSLMLLHGAQPGR